LGTAADFAVLAGSGVTNTGSSIIIYGDVGSFPTGSIEGLPDAMVSGTVYRAAEAVVGEAKDDLTAAYIDLANMEYDEDLSGTNLGGLILGPGVYRFSSGALLTGHLTLDVEDNPDALFVFQIGTQLTTASHSSVTMINAPENFCNKYWQVGTSAVLGSDTAFMGNILALTSITLDGGTLYGRALARNGAVTITNMEMISPLSPCVIPEPATMCLLGLGGLLLRRKK
jgi:type VI secretion system secreted protein VgrG